MTSPTTDRRQGLVGNTPIKAPVDCAATVPIALSGEQVIDGVATSTSRVLVMGQADAKTNGIYNSSTGPWTRASDADGNFDLVLGSLVLVTGGTLNKNLIYRLATTAPIIGSSALVWQVLLNLLNLGTAAGAGFVGYLFGQAYPAGSVGDSLNQVLTTLSNITSIDNDLLQQVATNLEAGTAVVADCFGDSTMWGADPANLANQVATPPPAQLRNFVNNFFGNAALTANNRAVSGTTATQMIAGTDGSGSTFAAKIAASAALVVYCNHGVNDAFGASSTTLAQYRTALLAFINTCRLFSKVPVLVTPHPCLTIGGFGSQARAAATGRFAEAMRDVARKHGVTLVDNSRYLKLLLGVDGFLPLAVLPDGVHGAQATYSRTGNNLAEAILGGQANALTRPNQRIPVSGPSTAATGQTFSQDATSRVGVGVTTGVGVGQTMRMIFKVDEPGMDVYMAGPIFSGGAASTVTVDGLGNYTFNQSIAGFVGTFWHDFETLIARNLEPGFHILIVTTTSNGGVGINYLRTRQAAKPILMPTAGIAPQPSQRTLLAAKLDNTSTGGGTQFVSDDLPVSRLIDGYEIEWTGQMLTNSGLIVGGNVGTNGAITGCEKAIIFGLDGGGNFAISEASAVATFTTTAVGVVNLTAASHLFRVSVTTAGLVTCFVDDAQIGTYNLVQPYFGGLLGLWKNGAGGVLTVTNLSRVWRL